MEGNIKMDIEKNKEYIVDIIDNGYEGEGIAKINDFTIFIPGAIKGEKVKLIIVKVLSSHAFGKLVEILYPLFGVIGIIQIITILKKVNSIAKNAKN